MIYVVIIFWISLTIFMSSDDDDDWIGLLAISFRRGSASRTFDDDADADADCNIV